MKLSLGHKVFLGNYTFLWRLARPFIKTNKRLRDDFSDRVSPEWWRACDIWIQAASGGESYLAKQLLDALQQLIAARPQQKLRILCTSCTKQGLGVLNTMRAEAGNTWPQLDISVRVFPLDEPKIMRQALFLASPRLVVLLETELWPGLLSACTEQDVPVMVLNGRMTEKSYAGYSVFESLWEEVAPRNILAMSEEDATRFAELFGYDRVSVMPNMKFDAVSETPPFPDPASPARALLPEAGEVILLASVREEEEKMLVPVIGYLREAAPESIIVVAPRHMERIAAWKEHVPDARLRSSLQGGKAVPGSVVVWDAFGELLGLYERCNAVFVGGSLAKLGGQNFLEAAGYGKVPVIGPHWKNFAWVGEDFFDAGLGVRVANADELGPMLLAALRHSPKPETVRERLAAYLAPRRGGTKQAAEAVWKAFQRYSQ